MGLLTLSELAGLGEDKKAMVVVQQPPGFMSPGRMLEAWGRRFKSLLYSQPKTWAGGVPVLRVGAGWSRSGVESAAQQARSSGFAREKVFAADLQRAYQAGGPGSTAWNMLLRRYPNRQHDIARAARARVAAQDKALALAQSRVRRQRQAAQKAPARRPVPAPAPRPAPYRTPTARSGLLTASTPWAPAAQTSRLAL